MDDDEDASVRLFVDLLGMDEHSARILASEGFTSLEELAYVPIAELDEIEGLSAAFIKNFRQLARERLEGLGS